MEQKDTEDMSTSSTVNFEQTKQIKGKHADRNFAKRAKKEK